MTAIRRRGRSVTAIQSMGPLNTAAVALGLASVASVVFVIEGLGDFRFMRISGAAIAVAVVVGLLACAAGWLGRPVLAVVAGVVFVAAAIVQLVSTATGNDWLGSNTSTMSFWLGLGVGLLTLGLTSRADNRTDEDARPSGRPLPQNSPSPSKGTR